MLASRHKKSAYIIQFARWQQPLRDLATSSTTDTGNSGVSDTEHTDSNPALQGDQSPQLLVPLFRWLTVHAIVRHVIR